MTELIFGGAASGKSEFAENEALRLKGPHYYLATMRHGSFSGEKRIAKHVARRDGSDFITIEKHTAIGDIADEVEGGTVLLECMTNLAANELFDTGAPINAEQEKTVIKKLCNDIDKLTSACDSLIVVSGDVFRDGIIYSRESEAYMRVLSKINRYLTDKSDRVYEMIYACHRRLK
ncbi:MAG: bifunctional adenosylcobinamide kinase/adenosylcobinamide-phosphate guanylyltransferase [Lachnospiraceae bacterium]|nr:bifunctional adenosylcobinamide kinase/adenosylcobinamide-phosphate guanylyltransferase [Lachnospiraceae bacterium]